MRIMASICIIGLLAYMLCHCQQAPAGPLSEVERAERACKGDELSILAKSSNIDVRAMVAKNPNTPETVLLNLANSMKLNTYAESDDRSIFFALLENPDLPTSVFSVLARKTPADWDFTDHCRAPIDLILQKMVQDNLYSKGDADYDEFQTLLAMRAKSSAAQILDFMSRAKNSSLVKVAARNAATPEASLRALYQRSKGDDFIKEHLAENPVLPADIMETLSHENNTDILAKLAENPSCPKAVLERLAKHSEPAVAEKAMKTYYYKNGGILLRPHS